MDITPYMWIIWLALILVFVIIEMLTLDFIFLMLGAGSLVGLVAELANAPWWAQIIIAGIAAVLLLTLVRPPLLRRIRRGADNTPSNLGAVLGMSGFALTPVSALDGLVKLANGETWTARVDTERASDVIPEGSAVRVLVINGATAVVVPEKESV